MKTNKTSNEQVLYFGKDEMGNIPAFPLGNVYISGRAGSGLDTLANYILMNMMEHYRPSKVVEVRPYFIGDADSVWSEAITQERWVPLFTEAAFVDTDYSEDPTYVLKEHLNLILERIREVEVDDTSGEISKISIYYVKMSNIVRSERDGVDAEKMQGIADLIRSITEEGSAKGVYLIMQFNSRVAFPSVLDCFDYRISTRNSAAESILLLGTEYAFNMAEKKSGECWVKNVATGTIKKLEYTFRPDTFIKKIIKAYAVRVGEKVK